MVTVQELIKMLKYLKSNEIVKILTKTRTIIQSGATTKLGTNKLAPIKSSMLMKSIEGEQKQSGALEYVKTLQDTSNLISNIQNCQQISTITSSEITEQVAKQQQIEQHLEHNQQQQQKNEDFKHKNNQSNDEQQQQQETYSSQQQTYSLFSVTSNLDADGCNLVSARIEGNKSNFINEITSTQDLKNNNRIPLNNTLTATNNSTAEKPVLPKTPSVLPSEVLTSPPKLSSPSTPSCLQYQRSQRIRKFYQQQLHQFHTQHNQSLWAKQKLTKFAMSSLAAEPLTSLKQDDFESIQQQIQQNPQPKQNGISCHSNSGLPNSPTSSADESNSSSASAAGKPCFNTGLSEIIKFMELIGNLKHTKRTGWVLRDVNDCESISGHMYRMSILTFLLDGSEGLNQIRCMELALVHDMAESLVGDITPFCGITKDQKRQMEFQAMEDICNLIKPRGKRIMELFEEYEQGESAESKFVKDLDRLDMVMQAFEYEKRDNCLLKHQEFFDSTEGKFNHPFVKKLISEIYEQRKTLAKAEGATPPDAVFVPEMKASSSSASPSPAITNGYTTEPKTTNETSS